MALPQNLNSMEYSAFFHLHFHRDYSDFITFVINELDLDYEDKILDLGCGAGWVSLELARRMPETKIIAIDNDENLIQVANINKAKEKIENVEFVTASLEKFDQFPKDYFDAVISYKIFHELGNHQFVLNEIKRILTKKGKYAISDYRSDLKRIAKAVIWFNGRTMEENFRDYWKKSFQSGFTLEEIVKVLIKTNLKDWKIDSSLFDFLIYSSISSNHK